jgi:hypothetical protein
VGEWKMRAKLLLEDFMEKYRNQSRIFRNRSVVVGSIFRSWNMAGWFLRNRRVPRRLFIPALQ